MAGHRHRVLVGVTETPIEPGELLDFVSDATAGAVVTFLGTVRDHAPGREGVTHLEYEAYDDVVESKIEEIIAEAEEPPPAKAKPKKSTPLHVVLDPGPPDLGDGAIVEPISQVDAADGRPAGLAAGGHLHLNRL